MNRKIRLLWDFRGPDSLETAKHHVIHLKEFATTKSLFFYEAAVIPQSNYFNVAFIMINESDLSVYKTALKPDRGTVVKT